MGFRAMVSGFGASFMDRALRQSVLSVTRAPGFGVQGIGCKGSGVRVWELGFRGQASRVGIRL